MRREASGEARHSGLRLALAAAAVLLMLFSGGCTLLLFSQPEGRMAPVLVLLVGGLPFAFGLLVWWLAMGRNGPTGEF